MRWLLIALVVPGCALFDPCEPSIEYSNEPGPDGQGCVDLELEGHPTPAIWYPAGTGAGLETCRPTPYGTSRSFYCDQGRWVELL